MNILIIRNAYPYDFGGGERFPVSLAEELATLGYGTTVVSRSPKLLELANSKNIKTIKGLWWQRQNFSGPSIVLFPVYFLWQIVLYFWYVSLVLRTGASIVHPQSRDDFIAATLAGKTLRRKVIWTDHADLKYVWQNHKTWYKNPVGKLVYQASKLADHITLVSFSEKKHIEDQLGHALPDKFQVIHNGVNDPGVEPVKRDSSDANAVVFAATSRLVTAKGIGELITAFKDLKNPGTRLWLIGEGPEEHTFKELAGDDPHIVFMGYPDNSLAYVASADIFVHPSYHEGFSISLVEAAMLGKPIIACDVGGNPEIVEAGVNGLLVSPKDSGQLCKAMSRLVGSASERKAMGLAAYETYKKDFIFSKIVSERFIPLYEK